MSAFFFFNDTATTEIYTLSLHDALPIWNGPRSWGGWRRWSTSPPPPGGSCRTTARPPDRKSTRLNSSHSQISYAVFCLKKKKRRKILTSEIIKRVSSESATASSRLSVLL